MYVYKCIKIHIYRLRKRGYTRDIGAHHTTHKIKRIWRIVLESGDVRQRKRAREREEQKGRGGGREGKEEEKIVKTIRERERE